MAERVQGVSSKDIAPKPAEFTLKNEEGLKELGFSDYEIGGGRTDWRRSRGGSSE